MAKKIVDITEKLSFDENPVLKVKVSPWKSILTQPLY